MQELLDILEEEHSIMDEPEIASLRQYLSDAIVKIRRHGPVAPLTPKEREAVKYALQDVGELYLLAGTSSGFDVESKTQETEHQSRGRKARIQAASLGICL